ncbi:hypothetical protein JL720_14123 [Aureococcus anophagefferens]|nr:hypothetical protein JL720_14123 [Aureococcus anophagefferens]
MARDMGKDTAEVQKKLSQLVRRERSTPRADEAKAKASGGETKRAKLDRLFAMDADSSDAPADEPQRLRRLENRRKGGTDADFAPAEGRRGRARRGRRLLLAGKIRRTPPSK